MIIVSIMIVNNSAPAIEDIAEPPEVVADLSGVLVSVLLVALPLSYHYV